MRLAILLSILLSGCVSQHLFKGGSIGEKEGLTYFSIECQGPINWLVVYKSGRLANDLSLYDSAAHIPCGKNSRNKGGELRLIKLKAGDYFIGTFANSSHLHLNEEKAITFTVTEQSINYIGALKVNAQYSGIKILLTAGFYDHESLDRNKLSSLHPSILNTYPYVKSIAENFVGRVRETPKALDYRYQYKPEQFDFQ
ncbi:MAG: hypothetical protein COB04_16935 [Gammaproteobacteria bacterium]|nr:MAG: hypothetical protein COB04_16935 [Gammaproteobacteria bacterium]